MGMITTNGTRLYYADGNHYVCYCTLHHRIEAVVSQRRVADHYVQNGLRSLLEKFKTQSVMADIGDDSRHMRQAYQQWFNNMKSKFGDKVYVY
jgi:1-aminocyclopropane-1-carboxylate deaminase/D-cysteine desulfhydrase-like pyridoxal-dependent ACC family enzyme